MKLYFWLHVCSTAWGLWNFAITFYSVPDSLSVFDFVWNLISSDEIPAMAWLWVIALVGGVCELQLAVFVCFHFSLQSQGQCEVFPQQCWPHGPRCKTEEMFEQWPDLCWSTTFAKPWLSSSVTWGMSHSFSKELQHWRFLLCCQELER